MIQYCSDVFVPVLELCCEYNQINTTKDGIVNCLSRMEVRPRVSCALLFWDNNFCKENLLGISVSLNDRNVVFATDLQLSIYS